MPPTDSPADRYSFVLRTAIEQVDREWGGSSLSPVADRVGERIYRALLAERILILAAGQDDDVSAETVRHVVAQGWSALVDKVNV